MKSGTVFWTLAGLSCPRSVTNGDDEPFGKASCHGWRMPVANTFMPFPAALNDRRSYRRPFFGPWSFVRPTSTPEYRRPSAPNAMPLSRIPAGAE